MPQTIFLNEATAARRRVPVALVDDTDGKTPETGVTLSAGDMKISKAGGAEANHAGSLVELAGGDYYYEFTQGEVNTLGYITGRIVKSGVRTFRVHAQVVAFDPYDGVRLGITALPNAAAGASGGLHVLGANAGNVSYSGTWTQTGHMLYSDGIRIQCSTSGRTAFHATGNGTGHGIFGEATSGVGIAASSSGNVGFVATSTDLGDTDIANLTIAGTLDVGTTDLGNVTTNNVTVSGVITATGGNDIRGIQVSSFVAGAITTAAHAANVFTSSLFASSVGEEFADAYLDRDMSLGTDSSSDTVRTPRSTYRQIRNKWEPISSDTIQFYKEDDTTPSHTGVLSTTPSAAPVTGFNPGA